MSENNYEENKKLYKDSFINDNLKYILFLLSCAVTVFFLYWFGFYKVRSNNLNYPELKSIFATYHLILIIIITIIVLISIATIIFIVLKTSNKKFQVDNNTITSILLGKTEKTIDFSNIKEVYTFRRIDKIVQFPYGVINCLAFRESSKDDWNIIKYSLGSDKEKDAGLELIDKIINEHVNNNISQLRNDLLKDKVLQFNYLSGINNEKRDDFDKNLYSLGNSFMKKIKKNTLARDFNHSNKDFLILEKDGVIFRDLKVVFETNDKIIIKKHTVTWPTSIKKKYPLGYTLKLLNSNNEIKIEIDLVCLVNGQLFFHLVKSLYEDMGNTHISIERSFLDDSELESEEKELLKKLSQYTPYKNLNETSNIIIDDQNKNEDIKLNVNTEDTNQIIYGDSKEDIKIDKEPKDDIINDVNKDNMGEPIQEEADSKIEEEIENDNIEESKTKNDNLLKDDVIINKESN